MSKKRRRPAEKSRVWLSPCLTSLSLCLFILVEAALVQRGLVKNDTIRYVMLVGVLLAGLIGALAGEGGAGGRLPLLLGPGVTALILLAAILAVKGEGNRAWPLSCVLLLLVPSLCRIIVGKRNRRGRRTKKNG